MENKCLLRRFQETDLNLNEARRIRESVDNGMIKPRDLKAEIILNLPPVAMVALGLATSVLTPFFSGSCFDCGKNDSETAKLDPGNAYYDPDGPFIAAVKGSRKRIDEANKQISAYKHSKQYMTDTAAQREATIENLWKNNTGNSLYDVNDNQSNESYYP